MEVLASITIEVINKGVTQVSFTGTPWWASLYLSISTNLWHPYAGRGGQRLKSILMVLGYLTVVRNSSFR